MRESLMPGRYLGGGGETGKARNEGWNCVATLNVDSADGLVIRVGSTGTKKTLFPRGAKDKIVLLYVKDVASMPFYGKVSWPSVV